MADMNTASTSQSPAVRVENLHGTGVITLDRPKALNALNHEMISAIAAALDTFRDDDAVQRVLLCSAGEKAYCAGGDVRSVRESDLTGDFTPGDDLFRDEYDMNHALATFPKPTIAVVDGIAMGGGLGVSAHAGIRVITERTWESMPEMAIGFITDVGISHAFTHLPHVPEESRTALGLFLATTAYRITADDLLWTGLATHILRDGDTVGFRESLVNEGLEAALGRTGGRDSAGTSALAENLEWITATFAGRTGQRSKSGSQRPRGVRRKRARDAGSRQPAVPGRGDGTVELLSAQHTAAGAGRRVCTGAAAASSA